MTKRSRKALGWLLVAAIGAAAVETAASDARPSVALALEIEGATDPAVEPFSEFAAGQSLRLGSSAEVEFLHYPTCETVTVRGGDLAFSEQRYSVRGGKVTDVKRGKCPTTVSLARDAQIGGVVLRSSPGPGVLSLATRPSFVITGAERQGYRKLRIRREGQTLFEGEIAGRRFQWPSGRAPLDPDGSYTLELRSAAGVARAFAFRAEERRGEPPLIVIRLD